MNNINSMIILVLERELEIIQNSILHIKGFIKGFEDNTTGNHTLPIKDAEAERDPEADLKTYQGHKLSKFSRGGWYARFTTFDKKVKAIYASTQALCYQKLKLALALDSDHKALAPLPLDLDEAKSSTLLQDDTTAYTLATWLTTWLDVYKKPKLKPSTLYKYELMIKKYFLPCSFASTALCELDAFVIQKWLNAIVFPRQREHLNLMLKDSLGKAFQLGYTPKNIMLPVDIGKVAKKQGNALSQSDISILDKHLNSLPYGIYFLICMYAGLRRNEALALEVSDINFSKRLITVNKQFNHMDKSKNIEVKTINSNRQVPIIPELYDRLYQYCQKVGAGKLFNFGDGKAQVYFNQIRNTLNIHYVTIHSLRHTFATLCDQRDVPPKLLQSFLGHSSISTTFNTYTHSHKDAEYIDSFINNLYKQKE